MLGFKFVSKLKHICFLLMALTLFAVGALAESSDKDLKEEDKTFSATEYLKLFVSNQYNIDKYGYTYLFDLGFIFRDAHGGKKITADELSFFIAYSSFFNDSQNLRSKHSVEDNHDEIFRVDSPEKSLPSNSIYYDALNIYLTAGIKKIIPPYQKNEKVPSLQKSSTHFGFQQQMKRHKTPAYGTTPLHVAVLKNDSTTLYWLLSDKLSVDKSNKNKQNNFDVNAPDALGHTPLHLALLTILSNSDYNDPIKASSYLRHIVQPLLEAGANINTTNNLGENILHNMMHLSLQRPAHPSKPKPWATERQLLQTQKVDLNFNLIAPWFRNNIMPRLSPDTLNAVDFRGHTPLIKAALSLQTSEDQQKEKLQVLKLLIAYGARISSTDEHGRNLKDILFAALNLRKSSVPALTEVLSQGGAALSSANESTAQLIKYVASLNQSAQELSNRNAADPEMVTLDPVPLLAMGYGDPVVIFSVNDGPSRQISFYSHSNEYYFLKAVYNNNLNAVFSLLEDNQFLIGQDLAVLDQPEEQGLIGMSTKLSTNATVKALYWATQNNYAEMVAYLLSKIMAEIVTEEDLVRSSPYYGGISTKDFYKITRMVFLWATEAGSKDVVMRIANLSHLDYDFTTSSSTMTFNRLVPELSTSVFSHNRPSKVAHESELVRKSLIADHKKDIVSPFDVKFAIQHNQFFLARAFLLMLLQKNEPELLTYAKVNAFTFKNDLKFGKQLNTQQQNIADNALYGMLSTALRTQNEELVDFVLKMSPDVISQSVIQWPSASYTKLDLSSDISPDLLHNSLNVFHSNGASKRQSRINNLSVATSLYPPNPVLLESVLKGVLNSTYDYYTDTTKMKKEKEQKKEQGVDVEDARFDFWKNNRLGPLAKLALNEIRFEAVKAPEYIQSYQNMFSQIMEAVVQQKKYQAALIGGKPSDYVNTKDQQRVLNPEDAKKFIASFKSYFDKQAAKTKKVQHESRIKKAAAEKKLDSSNANLSMIFYREDLERLNVKNMDSIQYTKDQQKQQITSWQGLLDRYTKQPKTCADQLSTKT